MILRWIAPDAKDRKSLSSARAIKRAKEISARNAASSLIDSTFNSQFSIDDAASASSSQRASLSKDLALDDMGESEFNAILEEVCDTVMPRKPPAVKSNHSSKSNAPSKSISTAAQGAADIPWATLFHKLGEETSVNLTQTLALLQEIALLHPNVAPAIANVTDKLEHTRRVALIAQQFSQLRGLPSLGSEQLSLRQVVSDAITRRARWLHRRKVKARLGLLDAQLCVNAQALASLIDELINWAGGMAQDIGFAVREPTPAQPHPQLLVIARVNTASIAPDQWQNVGWYLWHQLARSMGANAELQVTQEALSVTMDFAPPPVASQIAASTITSGLSNSDHADSLLHNPDTDMHSVIAGCRVLLLLSTHTLHEQAHRSLQHLGLQLSACASVEQAKVLLGVGSGTAQAHNARPQAVVFDGNLDAMQMMLLRQSVEHSHSQGRMAFVEISHQIGSDYHISHMGDSSTAHVSVQAIGHCLAPALVFELCKVI